MANYSTLGAKAFQAKNYTKAANFFIKASEGDPQNYINLENAGLCYFAMNQFKKAIPYFQRAIQFPGAKDGKSEFFIALSLVNLGQKNEACATLKQSINKGYPEATSFLPTVCR